MEELKEMKELIDAWMVRAESSYEESVAIAQGIPGLNGQEIKIDKESFKCGFVKGCEDVFKFIGEQSKKKTSQS